MGHGRCIVTGCSTNSNKEKAKNKEGTELDPKKKAHFFSVPKNGIELWKKALSKNKTPIKTGQSVCGKHFSKKDIRWRKILRGPNNIILGVSADFKVPKLKEGAVPSKNLDGNLEEETESSSDDEMFTQNLENCTDSNADDAFEDFDEVPHFEAFYHLAAETKISITKPTEPVPVFETIFNNEKSVVLPLNWTRQNLMFNGSRLVAFNQFVPKLENDIIQPCCSKQVLLDKNLQTTIFINRHKLEKETSEVRNVEVLTIEDLEYLLRIVQSWRICSGLKMDNINCNEATFVFLDKEGIYRSTECTLYISSISRSGCCDYCRKARKAVSQRIARMEKNPTLSRLRLSLTGSQKKKLDDMRREIKTLRRGRERSLARIKMLKELRIREREEFKRHQKTLEQMLMESSLDANQKLVTKEMLAATKQAPRGRRYSKIWISFCLTLHRKSPQVYKFLKINNVLPLPATQTLSRFAIQNPAVDQEISKLEASLEDEEDIEVITDIMFENEIVPSDELPDIEMETEVF